MENNDKKVEIIKKEIKSLKEDIEEIQSSCDHKEHKLIFKEKDKRVVKICIVCEKQIGYPSNDELKENGFI